MQLRGISVGRAYGVFWALLGACAWGYSGACASYLTSVAGVPVTWITPVRLLSGAVLFLVVALIKDRAQLKALLHHRRDVLRLAAFAIFGVLTTQVSYLSSISYTTAGTGTVLERLGLLVILAVVCIKGHRAPKRLELLGVILALLGTFIIATQGNPHALSIPFPGLMWGITSAFAMACYTILPGQLVKTYGSFSVIGLAMALGGVISFVLFRPFDIPVIYTPEMLGVMASMILIGTFCAYLFYLKGVAITGPMRAGLAGCAEPVSALVISALWLSSTITNWDLIGSALIIIMMFFVIQREEPATSQ